MNNLPLISVIIPTFNRADQTLNAINSVLKQTLLIDSPGSVELIVVDDGSSCNTGEIKSLLESSNGIFIRQENLGVSSARNRGVSLAKAPLIAFLDSDDQWLPEKLAVQLAVHENAVISHCNEVWIRRGKRVNPKLIHAKAKGNAFERCLELCCISPSAVMLEKQAFLKAGCFDEQLRVCEDYDLWVRLSSCNEIELIEVALVVKHGGHEDQLSASEPAMDRFRVFSLIKNYLECNFDSSQEDLLQKVLKNKIEVLLAGALKRKNQRTIGLFSMLDSIDTSDKKSLLAVFEKVKDKLLDTKIYCS